jgi:hypothetical protein
MTTRSTPERLDAAVESLLAGTRPAVEPDLRPLLRTASSLADALRPVPAGARFEARLAERLQAGSMRRRWLAAGAVSSVAVGATVTAYAVWRSSRRPHALPARLLQR